jgi:hypothetical protein
MAESRTLVVVLARVIRPTMSHDIAHPGQTLMIVRAEDL